MRYIEIPENMTNIEIMQNIKSNADELDSEEDLYPDVLIYLLYELEELELCLKSRTDV